MTVKLALLKSGEDIISDIEEMVIKDQVVGYFFNSPCSVKVLATDTETGKVPCKLQLTPWMPLTNDTKIPVTPDWVITIVEPMPQLKQMYENGVLKNDSQDVDTDEQSDSDQSD